jgi:hypothetical protein
METGSRFSEPHGSKKDRAKLSLDLGPDPLPSRLRELQERTTADFPETAKAGISFLFKNGPGALGSDSNGPPLSTTEPMVDGGQDKERQEHRSHQSTDHHRGQWPLHL